MFKLKKNHITFLTLFSTFVLLFSFSAIVEATENNGPSGAPYIEIPPISNSTNTNTNDPNYSFCGTGWTGTYELYITNQKMNLDDPFAFSNDDNMIKSDNHCSNQNGSIPSVILSLNTIYDLIVDFFCQQDWEKRFKLLLI